MAEIVSGAYLLTSCPAPGMICKVAWGSNAFNFFDAFMLALSFSPHTIVTGQVTPLKCEVKSNDRIECDSLIVSLFDNPMLSKLLLGIQRNKKFWKSIKNVGTLYCAPIKTSDATLSPWRIVKSRASSAPNDKPQIWSGSVALEYCRSRSAKIREYGNSSAKRTWPTHK